jgi:hypothetical protein
MVEVICLQMFDMAFEQFGSFLARLLMALLGREPAKANA